MAGSSPRLTYLRKVISDYFYLWRDGDTQVFAYDAKARDFEIGNTKAPRSGRWLGHRGRVVRRRQKPPRRIARPQAQGGPDSSRGQANQTLVEIGQFLNFGDLRITKVLGWGGLGIAFAVEGRRADRTPVKLVCKAALQQSGLMTKEKNNHVLMAGAKHVVQRVFLVNTPGEQRGQHGEARGHMDHHPAILFIEFMRRGDLSDVLNKAGVSNTPFPNHILWHIFDCLFRGVLAMAFPGKWHRSSEDPAREQVPLVSEYCHNLPLNETLGTMVHFDLDPFNVLVGDFDESEHVLAPVVKIADLGLAENIDLDLRRDPERMWGLRRAGKVEIYTPEQFAEEWDYIRHAPISHVEVAERETAGNYHWWTNMYQVAQIMWQLITLCHLEWPLILDEYLQPQRDGSLRKAWSYGGALLLEQFDHVDVNLRHLMVRCMNHNPLDRPSMEDIAVTISHHVNRQVTPREYQDIQKFWEQMYGDPSRPAETQPANLAGVAAAGAAGAAVGPAAPPAGRRPANLTGVAAAAAAAAGAAGPPAGRQPPVAHENDAKVEMLATQAAQAMAQQFPSRGRAQGWGPAPVQPAEQLQNGGQAAAVMALLQGADHQTASTARHRGPFMSFP